MLPNPEVREVSFEDYLKIFRQYSRVIASVVITIPLVALVYLIFTKPVYRATVSIVIEKTPPKVTQFEDIASTRGSVAELAQFYQTQLKVLESRRLAEEALKDLDIEKYPDLKRLKDPVRAILRKIKVEPVRNSQMVLVHVRDGDPFRGSFIANAIANAYIKLDVEARSKIAKEAGGWLEDQLVGIKEKMQSSEDLLNDYIQANRIVAVLDAEDKTETLLDNIKMERSRLETELADSTQKYKDEHPKIISLKAQLEDVQRKIDEETANLLELRQKMVQYNMLKEEVETQKQLYVSMLTRAKEASVSQKLEASGIRIIDYASAASCTVRPQKAQTMVLALLFAVIGGFGAALALAYIDSTISTAEDIRVYVKLPFLGYVPDIKSGQTNLICLKEPESITAEAFRAIRASVLFASPEDVPLKTLLVTSAVPQEGKSFISSNLAVAFAQLGRKTVLIDGDMRRATAHKIFGISHTPGLSDYLTGNEDLKKVISPSCVKNLSIIAAGTDAPNPGELLHSKKIDALIEALRADYDKILFDSPPLLSISDALVLAKIVDGVVVVTRGAVTRLQAVTSLKERLLSAKGKIVGVLINGVDVAKEDRYYYSHYYKQQAAKL